MYKSSKIKLKNERIKRKYLHWMKEAEGFSNKSIDSIEKGLWKYEEATNNEDYASFNDKKAEHFKKYLKTNINRRSKQTLGLTSQYHHLRHVKNFFTWLSGQPGYKSRVSANNIMYLQLSKKERRQATSSNEPKYPTLPQIKALCSFEVKSEIDKRD